MAARFALAGLAALALARPAVAAPPQVVVEIEDEDDPPPPPSAKPPVSTPAKPPVSEHPRAVSGPESAPEVVAPPTNAAGANAASWPVPSATVPGANAASANAPSSPVPAATGPEATSGAPVTSVEGDAAELELAELRARIEALERAARDRDRPAAVREGPPVRTGVRAELPPTAIGFGPGYGISGHGVRLSGYLQAQYQWSQLSQDQIQQGGASLNESRFAVRRGRVRVSGDWKWVAFDLELDGSTTRGPFVGVRQANASFVWRNPDATLPPYLMITAGLTESPFGHELRLGQREMMFMERTRGSLSFFPGPVDVGVRVRGGLGPFRYDLAVMNGTPLDDRAGGRGLTSDPTRAPDYIGRFGFEARPRKHAIGGGASLLYGTGFHRGQEAGKNRVEWNDLNENGAIDSGELIAVPGMAATPSLTFRRWAVGLDLQIALRSRAGWSQIWLEGTLASNLDRDFLVADPVAAGSDLREINAYVAFLQDLFGRAVIGARYDFYDPNTDLLDRRRGAFVPASSSIHTISPLVGAVLPQGKIPHVRGRLVFQYDAVIDALGRDARGVPGNLKNDQFILRLQAEF